MKYSIYTLSNPETGAVFYVGKTINLKTRFKSHLSLKDADNSFKNQIIEYILHHGAMPVIEEVDYFDCYLREDEDYVHELETYWMWQFKAWGFNLTNIEGLKSKTRYSRKFAHILEESTFEFVIKSIVRRWDQLKLIFDKINENNSLNYFQKDSLYASLTDGYNDILLHWNKETGVKFELYSDMSWLNKRPYSSMPSYITDYKNSHYEYLNSPFK